MTTGQPELYEEIDLRPYIEALLRSWYWIVVAAVVAAVVTFGIMSLPDPQYQSTALVAITKPRFDVQFDPRLQTIEDLGIGYGAYEEVAMSDELVASLLVELPFTPSGVSSVDAFKEDTLDASIGDNETLLFLSVTSSDPDEAATIANAWALLVVERANELYGNAGTESVEFLEIQLIEAEADLVAAEIALVNFQGRNEERILQNELNNLVNRQQRYLNLQTNLEDLLRDIVAFRDLLAQRPDTESLSQADQLTMLSLQADIFNSPLGNVQLDLNNDLDLLSSGRSDIIVTLNDLSTMLEDRNVTFDQGIEDLSPQILEIQERLITLDNERNRLDTELARARDSKALFSRSLDESQIASQDVGNQVRLAGRAIEPVQPLSSGRLSTTLVAILGACAVSTAWIVAREWWNQNPF